MAKIGSQIKTSKDFVLTDASVQVGPSADISKFTQATHGIGMTKEVSVKVETSKVELHDGVEQTLVASETIGITPIISFNIFEFSAQNMAYAQGLGGTYATQTDTSAVDSAVNVDATVINVTAGDGAKFSIGDGMLIEDGDEVIVAKVKSILVDALTVTAPLPAINAGAKIYITNILAPKSSDVAPDLAMKLVGTTISGDPVSLEFPKVVIESGFEFAFDTGNYTSIPFEWKGLLVLPNDALYTEYKGEVYRVNSR